jgi:CDGSH-type Zn-finger protein
MNKPIVAGKSPIVQAVKPASFYWCSCGQSKGQPFVDGSHARLG